MNKTRSGARALYTWHTLPLVIRMEPLIKHAILLPVLFRRQTCYCSLLPPCEWKHNIDSLTPARTQAHLVATNEQGSKSIKLFFFTNEKWPPLAIKHYLVYAFTATIKREVCVDLTISYAHIANDSQQIHFIIGRILAENVG